MPDFDKETGNTANLGGSEFYGHGNQFRSPVKNKKPLWQKQQANVDQIDEQDENVHWSGVQKKPVTCDAYGNPKPSQENLKMMNKTPDLSTRGGSGGGLFG